MAQEDWVVEVGGEEYSTDEETLRSWIADGRVTANHRVRRGSLPWTEARLAPPLRALFDTSSGTSRPTRAKIVVSTGTVPEPYEIIDTIFALDSSPAKVFQSDHADEAFSKVVVKLRKRCRELNGDAVIYTQFEYRTAVDGIFGKVQVVEFFAYGTAVRFSNE